MKKILQILISFFALLLNLIACGNSAIKTDSIQEGKNLDQAIETTVLDFFEKRIHNKIRKINVGSWEIFYQSTDFVYFGYPRLSGIFSNSRVVDQFYKVNRNELKKAFPGYEKIHGVTVKPQFFHAVFDLEKKLTPELKEIRYQDYYEAKLQGDFIEIRIRYNLIFPEKESQGIYKLFFDKTSGKFIKIEKITGSQ